MDNKADIEWDKLGFSYVKTDFRYVSFWKEGAWECGSLIEDNKITISESSTSIHYGQQCFEGLKAYMSKDGSIRLFRPDENSKRFNRSCARLLMPQIPQEMFIESCVQVVKANKKFVPPYGTGATLYLRPYMIGIGDNLGVKPALQYMFGIFCSPVGAYFKGGLTPVDFCTTDYDRAAPNGTGAAKVGGNYASSLLPHLVAVKNGFADCIYLDPKTHTKIEEVGAANFFGITNDNRFVTPKSESILGSITKYSLIHVARNYLCMQVEERDVFIDRLGEFIEAGACGTAAVITPIGAIEHNGKTHVFYDRKNVGPVTKKLYETLTGIQFGDVAAPDGWIYKIIF